jgi:NADH-quinone oxidoreductase subunit D
MTEFVSTGSLLEPHVVEGSGDTTMVLNMGPQHPSTHGVLRLVIEIDGETVLKVVPDIGYLHTGIEKTCEAKFYQQVVPMTDRIDYLSPMSNTLCYCLAVE